MKRLALFSLLVGLVGAAFVVPWALNSIGRAKASVEAHQKAVAEMEAVASPVPRPTPDPAAVAAARAEALQKAAAQKEAAEQAARLKAALAEVALPKPAPKPTPQPAYSIVPTGSAELIPLEGWVDQPNKDRPGRVHTDLMVRHVKPTVRPRVSVRAPCLVMTARPAERIERPYGWLKVPARTIPVPCGK